VTEVADADATAEEARADGADEAGAGAERNGREARGPWWRRPLVVGAGCLVLLAVPLAVALGVLHNPRWYPLLDLAQAEMRVRDVGSSHPTLVGAAGRIEAFGVRGSHPGPLAFWALRPVYTLMGDTAFGLQVATASLNLAAMAVVLWIGNRRGGVRLMLALAALLAVLTHLYGAAILTEAWNPYLPLLWWLVFLLAAWSVLCDDMPLLLVAVVAGSFCAQTHVPYAGSVAGMLAFLAVVIAVRAARCDRAGRRRLAGWSLGSAGALAVLWLPPVVDELRHSPGNLAIIRETFVNPPEPALGLGRDALELWVSHLDVWHLPQSAWSFAVAPVGSVTAGALLLALWAGAAAVALSRRRAEPALWRLHVAVAMALALGLVSISRIHGVVFHYLLLWALGTTVLAIVATVWSGVSLWTTLPVRWRPRWAPATGGAVLVAMLLASTAALTSDAVDAVAPDPVESSVLAHVAPGTIAALRAGRAPGGGPDGRYVVRWSDSLSIMPAGYGLVLELERAGFDVGAVPAMSTNVVPHRARTDDEATATVLMVRGEAGVSRVRAAADGTQLVEVAYHEPRTPAQVERYDELRADVVSGLRAAGLGDLVATLDTRVFMVSLDKRVPAPVGSAVLEMLELGQPVAVFVGPPGTAWLEQIDPRLLGF
jgi:hypothetical protein